MLTRVLQFYLLPTCSSVASSSLGVLLDFPTSEMCAFWIQRSTLQKCTAAEVVLGMALFGTILTGN